MANENEPAKLLLPYLQRADELQKHEPLVAYYCRLYAMERGLKIPSNERTKTTNSILMSLMKQLEKDKKSLKLGPDDHLHLEGFALNVFAKADKQDRAGRADLNTAKTFYAASIFFEILNQFGELQQDLEQKQKYAAWKAADIRKALKEGRKPVPGPPGDDIDVSVPSSMPSDEHDLDRSTSDPGIRPAPESDASPELYDKVTRQHSANFPPPSNVPPPSNMPPSSNIPASPSDGPTSPSYHADDYPANNYRQPPPTNRSENHSYSQSYHQQPYQQEPQPQHYPSQEVQSPHVPQHYPSHDVQSPQLPQHYASHDVQSPQLPQHYASHDVQSPNLPQHYPSHDAQLYSYPNFQSYPSFSESSVPAAQSHYPSYYQGSDASYPNSSAPNIVNYQPSAQYSSNGSNGGVPEAAPSVAQKYQYDSNYQPPPEKIAEAHKAARFAVGALAFDDVSIAVDYLKKSLELLTNPSAGQ